MSNVVECKDCKNIYDCERTYLGCCTDGEEWEIEPVQMKWEHIAFCDWEAKGARGDFRVWKDGKVWKGRYRSADNLHLLFLPVQKSVKAIKKLCENSSLWEGGE